MTKIRFTSIKPGFVFEHEGVKLKAVDVIRANDCKGCFFLDKSHYCYMYSCIEIPLDKQKHDLIFKKVEDENSI